VGGARGWHSKKPRKNGETRRRGIEEAAEAAEDEMGEEKGEGV